MRIAYLTNVYPKLSHTFIRREIVGIEAAGATVLRLSIRPADEEFASAADQREQRNTIAILGLGWLRMAWDVLCNLARRPIAAARALGQVVRLGNRSDSGILRHLAYLAEACSLVRILERERVEHLHVHFGTNAATVALLARVLSGIPFSMTVHGAVEYDSPVQIHLGLKVARSSFVAVISSFGLSQTSRWSRVEDWPKIHVIRCGVDEGFLGAPVVPVPPEPQLVSVGRLSAEKGHIVLLRAVAVLKSEGSPIRVVIIGDGPLRETLTRMVADLDVEDRIELTGSLPEADVRRHILASRGLVLPSFIEGVPVTMMEALALCRPVIASRVGGVPELLEDGVDGWLVTPGLLDDLVVALRAILRATPERLLEMGLEGRRKVSERHDSRVEAGRLMELFRSSRA